MDAAPSQAAAPLANDLSCMQLITTSAAPSLSATTSAPVIFRFSDLPFELQLEIWEYAIAAESQGQLNQNFFFDARVHHYRNPHRFPSCYAGFIRASSKVYNLERDELQFTTRKAMMAVCRVSRKYALEQWKKEIETIVVTLNEHNSKPTDRFWLTNTRAELLGLLDARIQGLTRRLNA